MKNLRLIERLLGVACFALCMPSYALTNSTPHTYPSGVSVAAQIGSDLYDSLDAKYRKKLEAHPVCTVALDAPAMGLTPTNDDNKTLYQLSITVGLVDLINHIAHAKAIDKIQPGYFAQYMSDLATPGNLPVAPNMTEDRFWSDDVMNDQAGYFNQMMGMTVAINLSHHYLGKFDKYADRMPAGKLVPINNFLTSSEWDTGVRAGAVNSLSCAFGTEGVKALFDAIDKMPHRPAWTAYIVPENIDIKKLNKQLAKYEVDFFHGQLN